MFEEEDSIYSSPVSPPYYDAADDESIVMSDVYEDNSSQASNSAFEEAQSISIPLQHPDRIQLYSRVLQTIHDVDRAYFQQQDVYWSKFRLTLVARDPKAVSTAKVIATWRDLYDLYTKSRSILYHLLEQTAVLHQVNCNKVNSLALPLRDFLLDAGYQIPKINSAIPPPPPVVTSEASETAATKSKRKPAELLPPLHTIVTPHQSSYSPGGSTPPRNNVVIPSPIVSPHSSRSNSPVGNPPDEDTMGHYSLLPKFDTNTDPQTFVDLFETWLSAAGIQDLTKKKQNFLLALNTPTGQMWSSLNKDLVDDAQVSLEAMIKSFLSDFSQKRAVSMNDFLKTEMGAFEQAMAFVIKMRYLFNLYMKGLPEATQVEYCILKMQIPLMNFVKAGGTPNNWADLIKKVKEYQDLVPQIQPTALPSTAAGSSSVPTVNQLQVNGDPMQLLMLQMQNMTLEINRLKTSNNRRGQSNSRGNNRQQGRSNNGNQQSRGNHRRGNSRGNRGNRGSNRSNVECYNCGRRGHYQADCRKPRNSNSRSAAPGGNPPPQQSYGRVQTVTANGQNYAIVPVPENNYGMATPQAAHLTLTD